MSPVQVSQGSLAGPNQHILALSLPAVTPASCCAAPAVYCTPDTPTPATLPAPPCPDQPALPYSSNWTVLVDSTGTKAYIWMEAKQGQTAAAAACAALATSTRTAHLVTYSSYAEQWAVESYMRSMGWYYTYWMGLTSSGSIWCVPQPADACMLEQQQACLHASTARDAATLYQSATGGAVKQL